jgi:hypothetical protein
MSINEMYHTVMQKLLQLRPKERITRIRGMGKLITGIWSSRSVHLSRVAAKVPGQARTPSITRGLRRLVDNAAIVAEKWYAPIAQEWLYAAAQTVGEIRVIWDSTKIGFGYQMLLVSLAYRRRAIPIAWCWHKGPKGHTSAKTQRDLLERVRAMVPKEVPVLLVGDTEFESGEIQQWANTWGWKYVLRQKPNNLAQVDGQWQSLASLAPSPGGSRWLEGIHLTAKNALSANVLLIWALGEERPWLLATNLPTSTATRRAYKRRMWIDESFGDLKSHGFDLQSTHLRDPERLSRLTLAVFLLYVWCMATAQRVIKNGWRAWVDRKDRRDLSLFQIGLRFIDRCLANQAAVSIHFFPLPAAKLSGS